MISSATSEIYVEREERELIPSDRPLAPFISVNPGRMHGEPCFTGTRIPIQTLFDPVEGDDPMSEFLTDFPDVSKEMAVAVFGLASRGLLRFLREEQELVPAESPCFKGTRVPTQMLFDHVTTGDPLSAFLQRFPDVSREQALGVVILSRGFLKGLRRL